MLRGGHEDEDDEDVRRNPTARMIKRAGQAEIVADFAKAATALNRLAAVSTLQGAQAQEDNYEQVKTLKEVLEEREEQMKDIEQLQGKFS